MFCFDRPPQQLTFWPQFNGFVHLLPPLFSLDQAKKLLYFVPFHHCILPREMKRERALARKKAGVKGKLKLGSYRVRKIK